MSLPIHQNIKEKLEHFNKNHKSMWCSSFGIAFDLHTKSMDSITGMMKKKYFRIFLGCTIISDDRARDVITLY